MKHKQRMAAEAAKEEREAALLRAWPHGLPVGGGQGWAGRALSALLRDMLQTKLCRATAHRRQGSSQGSSCLSPC